MEKKSSNINIDFLKNNKDQKFIISNFVMLSSNCIEYIKNNCSYIIYEHDHKYLKKKPNFLQKFYSSKTRISQL